MTRIVDSPPDYSEVDALIAGLTDLDLAAATVSQTRSPPRPPRTPPPNDPSPQSPRPTPQTPRRPTSQAYDFESPTRSGRTTQWSEASFYSQAVRGGRVRGLWRSPQSSRQGRKAYVVFYGREPGVYSEWFGATGAELQVKRVRYTLHQGYATLDEARAAYEYAHARGWTGVRDSRPPSPSDPPPRAISALPVPLALDIVSHNPLHGATASAPKWHVVFAGITPGIYGSYLECALNTLGLRAASYQSAATRAAAVLLWETAMTAGHIRVLTPPYPV